MSIEDQKLQTKNQTKTRMKQTWNFKQRQRRSFYVLTVAGAHCPYRIQHPGSDDHYLSFVETLEPTLRSRRCMRFLPSFGLAQLIQHLSQPPTQDHWYISSAELSPTNQPPTSIPNIKIKISVGVIIAGHPNMRRCALLCLMHSIWESPLRRIDLIRSRLNRSLGSLFSR